MSNWNVGEIWEWFDEELLEFEPEYQSQFFLILESGFPNPDARYMLNLESGEKEINFPAYGHNNWKRIA